MYIDDYLDVHITRCPQVMKFQCWVIAGCFFYGLVIRAHGYPTLQHHGGLLPSSLQVFTSQVMKEPIWRWVQLHQPLPNRSKNWPFKESRLGILSRVVVARFLDPFLGSCFLFSYPKGKSVNVLQSQHLKFMWNPPTKASVGFGPSPMAYGL